jgi:hypothetical protein
MTTLTPSYHAEACVAAVARSPPLLLRGCCSLLLLLLGYLKFGKQPAVTVTAARRVVGTATNKKPARKLMHADTHAHAHARATHEHAHTLTRYVHQHTHAHTPFPTVLLLRAPRNVAAAAVVVQCRRYSPDDNRFDHRQFLCVARATADMQRTLLARSLTFS